MQKLSVIIGIIVGTLVISAFVVDRIVVPAAQAGYVQDEEMDSVQKDIRDIDGRVIRLETAIDGIQKALDRIEVKLGTNHSR